MASVSLRPLLADAVSAFGSAFAGRESDATELLVELIVGLSNYRQEGLQYAPVVFVAADLEAALVTLRASDPILIGTEAHAATAAKTALRNCAPLGEGRRWAVFVQLVPAGGLQYGLLCLESSPLRPTSFEQLRRTRSGGPLVVGLTQVRSGVVEVRTSLGTGTHFDFSGSQQEARAPGYVVQEFVAAVTSAAPDQVRAQLQAFYYRISVDIMTGDHGALAAVVQTGAEVPAALGDGIWLPAPLNLVPWIARDAAESSGEGARVLLSYAQLIRRMTMMDGVTVFGADGTVRAYGCFLREAVASKAVTHVVGGARQRAFQVLRSYVGKGLVAALYRSQDGAADCVSQLGP